MEKILPVLALLFVLVATPVIAHSKDPDNLPRPVTIEGDCSPEASWKNHGAYVSCVAKNHEGAAAVSAAARSDIGKDTEDDEDIEDGDKVSPTPSVSPSPSPEGLILSTKTSVSSEILAKIIQRVENLIDRLQDLL